MPVYALDGKLFDGKTDPGPNDVREVCVENETTDELGDMTVMVP
jgi:hypothetical protein